MKNLPLEKYPGFVVILFPTTVVGLNRVVQEFDIANLPLLRAVIKEMFRLHSCSSVRKA
jgi:hypothetical protein